MSRLADKVASVYSTGPNTAVERTAHSVRSSLAAARIVTLWGKLKHVYYDNAHEWVLSPFQEGPCQDKDPSILSHPNLLIFRTYCSYF